MSKQKHDKLYLDLPAALPKGFVVPKNSSEQKELAKLRKKAKDEQILERKNELVLRKLPAAVAEAKRQKPEPKPEVKPAAPKLEAKPAGKPAVKPAPKKPAK